MTNTASALLYKLPSLIHLGLDNLVEGAEAAAIAIHKVAFTPPAGGDPLLLEKLAALRPYADRIKAANLEAVRRVESSQPAWMGIGIARDVIPTLKPNVFLHAGPPIAWERMSGPLRGAIIGGLLFEGMAKTPEEATHLAASGGVRFEPCHHHAAVGPMAGLITPSMPVSIIEDQAGEGKGYRTYCTLNEGLGKVLRYGAYSQEVLDRLRYMAYELAPLLARTLAARGPIDLKLIMAQALQMGDEGHNRNRAGTSLIFRELAPPMVGLGSSEEVKRALTFIHQNDHFFLNLSMPMAKCMLLAAQGTPYASMFSVMARNGTDFGIQLASLPGQWFTGPAQPVKGLYFPGYSAADANPDIGDSAITETVGIGAFSMAAAPAIVQFIGGSSEDALKTTRHMARITLAQNSTWAIPSLGFAGAPTGIDLCRCLELNVLPVINTGIAHKDPGVGQVGAGLTNPPWAALHAALGAFVEHCRTCSGL